MSRLIRWAIRGYLALVGRYLDTRDTAWANNTHQGDDA